MEKMTIDELYEKWYVSPPGRWNFNGISIDFWSVGNTDEGILAFFKKEADAWRFRKDKIKRILNDYYGE